MSQSNLLLGALAANGGPTQTNGSALINAAGTDCIGADQRGLVRNVGACDVGSVEVGATLADAIFANDFEL